MNGGGEVSPAIEHYRWSIPIQQQHTVDCQILEGIPFPLLEGSKKTVFIVIDYEIPWGILGYCQSEKAEADEPLGCSQTSTFCGQLQITH